MRKKIFLFIFIIVFAIIGVELFYSDEPIYNFKNLREKNFVLGIKDDNYSSLTIENDSLTWILLDLFEELGVDRTQMADNINNISTLSSGKIDGLAFIANDNTPKKNIVLSDPIFNDNIYISSNFKPLFNNMDLKDQIIYVSKKDVNLLPYLNRYLKIFNLNSKVVLVDDLSLYTNNYFLNTEFSNIFGSNRLFIGFLPPFSIGVNKKYEYLVPEINRLLKEKYRAKVNMFLKKKYQHLEHQMFLNKLTSYEKDLLSEVTSLKTNYSNIFNFSFFSSSDNNYLGFIPDYCKKIEAITGIKIISNENKSENKNALDRLKANEIDFVIFPASNKQKFEKISFSNPITYIPINLFSKQNKKSDLLGILDDDTSKQVAKIYFSDFKTKNYTSFEEMFNDLEKDKIGYVLTGISPSSIEFHIDEIKEVEKIPLTAAFNEKNSALKDIFNKAFNFISDREIQNLTNLSIMKFNSYYKPNFYKSKTFFMIVFVFVFLSTYLITKIIQDYKLKKLLKYDTLTKLQSRYSFNLMCLEQKSSFGCVGILDLDNFKFVNDKYGHSTGDKVLIEIAKILEDVFGKNKAFRISGDEFYIFEKNCKNNNKIKKFIKLAKTSPTLTLYGITASFGYYFKDNKTSMIEAFEKADKAMYKAKKIPDFSMKEGY